MSTNIIDIFGSKVFNDDVMRRRLPKQVYKSLSRTNKQGLKLQPDIADQVASAMKDWAIENGATHFSHWFQPMNNITAGKHTAFLNMDENSRALVEFSGKALVQGEPDASSFPNGGLRATFEARGYTAWDPTSPAFIRDETLYIPTAFCSYTGEALDTKTPLLRSMQAISEQALRVIRLFGNFTSKRVIPTVGAEQEYFLIDRDLYEKRLDLKLCGRTLFGQKPPKGQELDDHYCGRIRIRVAEFMKQLDENLWKLGVTSITKHNEAAPCQHELAPLFAYANIATDNNQLIMETMRITAKKLGLACLLHEKPFAGVNGSGKHNNWSLATDDGYNLLDPGKTPYENMQFLIFVCAVLCAIDKHADLIRLGAANVGNEHRLGGNEAPPSIISVYLGDDLNRILNEIANGDPHQENLSNFLTTGVATLPQLPMDSSDRNRTSPIAFTGNRFEFRMVGSSDSVANANVYINTAVAESLAKIADRLENTADFDAEIKSIITDSIKKHGKVIFDGDGYSKNWELEAEKRGLPNIRTCVDAFSAIIKPENISLLERFEVLSKSECESRYDIMRENYENVILIEAKTMLEMTRRQILPACIEYLGELTKTLSSVQSSLKITNNSISKLALELSELIENIYTNIEALNSQVENLPEEKQSHAVYCRDVIFEQMNKLRVYVDRSESIVPKKYWPIPGYTELMYYV